MQNFEYSNVKIFREHDLMCNFILAVLNSSQGGLTKTSSNPISTRRPFRQVFIEVEKMFNEISTRGGRGRRGGKKGRRGEMRVQGDHENSLKEEMVGRGNTVAVVNIVLTSLHCLGRGFDNQKAARPSGKSENEITSGDQTFKACICVGHWSKRYYILPRKSS